MPRGKRKSEYEDYTEKLIPTHVTITRERGDVTFVFEINGFKGTDTGQIYYKGKDVLEIERFLDKRDAIQIQEFSKVGLVLNFETPQTVTSSNISGAYPPILAPEIFRPRNTMLLTIPVTESTT
jgi:hypothetical protein